MKVGYSILGGLVLSAGAVATPALAQMEDAPTTPFYSGAYVAPLGTWVHGTKGNTDDGWGGALAAGYRTDDYAVEVQLGYAGVDGNPRGSVDETTAALFGLYFPFKALPNLYGTVGAGLLNLKGYPSDSGETDFGTLMLAGGLGYLWHFGNERYDWGLRTEVLYRAAEPPKSTRTREGLPSNIGDVVVNIGLYLPIGRKAPQPEAASEPVAVVPPVAVAPVDSDGDGVNDDLDNCPNTPAGTQVDEHGCPLPPPCKPPEPGQLADFSGCAVGKSIVLRGVNFEYDKARLTIDAQTILEGVASSLQASPDVQVEIGGHTDSRGSDSYNQRLSEERAQSVMHYLSEHGVDAARMTAKGYGETQPIADNDTDEGRELNRRVELKILGSGATDGAAEPAPAGADAAPVDATSPDGGDAAMAPAADDAAMPMQDGMAMPEEDGATAPQQ